MTARFFALLTNIGAAKLANATALGTRLEITQMAVGDGGGTLPTPNPAQTKLVNEQRRAALNMLTIDPINTSQIIAEQVIPETEGGWWIREIGLLDKDGDLVAIANCAESYKPQLQEGSGRTQTIRMILIVSSTAAVTLKIDPSVVLATRKYADDKAIEVKQYADSLLTEHEKSRNHPDASKTEKGFVKLSSATTSDSEVLAATPKAVKTVAEAAAKALDDHGKDANPHDQYFQIANLLSEIKAQGPAALAETLANLGISENLIPVGIPLPWSTATPPAGWLKCNGSVFNKTQFPQLALVYPSGYLPDLRGMFIRGWDDGRNVDAGRELGSEQLSDNKSHNHNLITWGVTHTGLGGSDTSIPAPPGGTPNGGTGLGTVPTQTLTGGSGSTYIATSAITASGGSESRPRNIAFNYIVRAA